MRAVTAATAAAILEIDRKQLDNLLSRLGEAALPAGRQGLERRIPMPLLEALFLTLDLSRGLGAPAREAFQAARAILGQTSSRIDLHDGFVGTVTLGAFLQVGADLGALRRDIERRYTAAVESVVRRPRGRPPRRRAAGGNNYE